MFRTSAFRRAFIWLIAIPFALAAGVQAWAARRTAEERVSAWLGLAPRLATVLLLFIVVAAVAPHFGPSLDGH